MVTKTKLSTKAKGLGWRHVQAREAHLRRHHDGALCDECGRPMYRDRTRNYDYDPDSTNPTSGTLQADHSKMSRAEALRRGLPIPLPDRLLHGECNRRRGEGLNDQSAWVNSGRALANVSTDRLLMPWPW
jgi:hypothetical protein